MINKLEKQQLVVLSLCNHINILIPGYLQYVGETTKPSINSLMFIYKFEYLQSEIQEYDNSLHIHTHDEVYSWNCFIKLNSIKILKTSDT